MIIIIIIHRKPDSSPAGWPARRHTHAGRPPRGFLVAACPEPRLAPPDRFILTWRFELPWTEPTRGARGKRKRARGSRDGRRRWPSPGALVK